MESKEQLQKKQEPQYSRSIITALAFYKKSLLVGEGPYLKVFDLQKKQISEQITALPAFFQICGLEVFEEDRCLVVKGELCFKVYSLMPSQFMKEMYFFKGMGLDKVISVRMDAGHFTILFAHNFAEVWSMGSGQTQERVFCEEECILYSGAINDLGMVAAGTVFRSILVWNPALKINGKSGVVYRLEGHRGPIFDIKFITPSILASVSDDRSARVWHLSLDTPGQYSQLYEFTGHRSRLWSVNSMFQNDRLFLVTSSEDATCKIWPTNITKAQLASDSIGQPSNLIQVQKSSYTLKGHIGKNIRALAVNSSLVASGGDDGSVKVWNLNDVDLSPSIQIEEEKHSVINLKVHDRGISTEEVQIRALTIYFEDDEEQSPVAMVGTNEGKLVQIMKDQTGHYQRRIMYQSKQQQIIHDVNVGRRTIVSESGRHRFCVISIGDGQLAIFRLRLRQSPQISRPSFEDLPMDMFQLSKIKFINCFIFNEEENFYQVNFDIMAATGMQEFFQIQYAFIKSTSLPPFDNGEWKMMKLERVYKTTIKTQFVCAEMADKSFLVGDTKGNMYLFDYEKQGQEEIKRMEDEVKPEEVSPRMYLKAHKNQKMMSIKYYKEQKKIYSTSKDCFVNVFIIDSNKTLQNIQSIKEQELSLIHEVFIKSERMVIFGHYGSLAYLFDKSQNIQLMNLDTKSSYRPLKLLLSEKTSEDNFGKKFVFCYGNGDEVVILDQTKGKDPHSEQESLSSLTLQEALHGRRIQCVCGIPLWEGKVLVLSGSEDTYMKVWEYCTVGKNLTITQTFATHVGAIRSISKTKLSSTSYLVVSAGSRMQANIYSVSLTPSSHSYQFTHLISFMRSKEQDALKDYIIYSAKVAHLNSKSYVFFGCSNGELQSHFVNDQKKRLEQVQSLQLNSAIMRMRKLKLNGKVFLVCGLSEGYVQIVEVGQSGELTKVQSFDLGHDFGVNALDYFLLENSLIIATGGDDQQILLLQVQCSDFALLNKYSCFAHTSGIKGLVVYEKEGEILVASSSYDQRFKEWKLNVEEFSLHRKAVVRHCLADINGMFKFKVGEQTLKVLVGQGLVIF